MLAATAQTPSPLLSANALQGRVVLALTANPFYAMRGIRPGASLPTAVKALHTGTVFHVGLNDWYMAPDGSSTTVLKVRDGTIQEIGIADISLTTRQSPAHLHHQLLLTLVRPRGIAAVR